MDRVQTGHQLFFSATEVQEKLFTSSISSTSTVLFFMLNQLKLLLTFTFALSCKSMRFVQRVTVKRGRRVFMHHFQAKKSFVLSSFPFHNWLHVFLSYFFLSHISSRNFFFNLCTDVRQVRVKYEFDRNSNTLA